MARRDRFEDFLKGQFLKDPRIARLMGLVPSGKGQNDDSRAESLSPDELIVEWIDSLDGFCTEHSVGKQRLGAKLKGRIEVVKVRPTDGCDINLFCGGSGYRATFQFDLDNYLMSMQCSCGHYGLCEHTWLIASRLRQMLEDEDSELVRGICGTTSQERSVQQTLSLIQTLVQNARQDAMNARESHKADSKPLTRFRWGLYVDPYGRTLVIRPCLQQEKKSGGWTQGKETTLEAFLKSPKDVWTATDQQLADLIQVDRSHRASVEIADALRVLAGTDQVLFESQPFRLASRPLEVVVVEEEGGLRLSTTANETCRALAARRAELTDVRRGVAVVDRDGEEILFFPGPLHSYSICRQLQEKSAPIAMEHKDTLLKELEPLQGCMSVRLPETIAGREVPYDGQPVLMLQLRRNGALDAGLQIRDRYEMLQFPGEGVLRHRETVDGEPVQFLRNAGAEPRQCDELATRLRLRRGTPLSRWSWRLTDAEEISSLMAAAGELVDRKELVVLWHKDSVSRFDMIGRVSAANVRVEVSRQRDWFGLSGTCRVGDQEIPLKDLLAGMHGRPMNGLLEVSPGKWAAVAEELRNALARLADVSLENRGKLQLDASAAPIVSVLEAAQIQVAADKHWEKCLKKLREAEDLPFEPPAGLTASLRDYQLDGFRWLCRLSHWGIGGILADDMGLGKTVQTLALLLTRVESGPALVIAPTSLGFNWQKECERFTPALRPILFRETDRLELKNHVGDGDLVICSYGLALRSAELLKEIKWGTLILDEAQNIKNSNSKTATQIRTFEADWKLALTGTPMENHLGELWSLFHTVAPGVLGSWEQFRRRFAGPIEKDQNSDRREGLSRVIAPFILRRSKAEVLKDLPERTETNLLVDLSPDERLRYDQMRLAAVSQLDELGDENLSHDQRFRVLQMLTRLRQLSCHVGLVDDSWTGSSSKLEVLMERLEQLKERGSRPLIFSQFTSHLAKIREACDKAGISYQYLDGQTTPAQRQERVTAFQNGESDAFLISLKAGGTGLNLTAADYVIHMDPWWNPAVEDQATDRAHRIGQTKPVIVYRIIARGTIEEQILKLHDEKRDLVDGVLSGADAAAKLSTKDLADLIREGVDVKVR